VHPPQLGAQPRDLRGRLLQGPRRAGVSPRSGREPVAPLVEQRFRHPQFFRHLPHGALAVQRQFDRLPLVVLVVLPARLVLVRLAFTHGVAGAALIPTGLFTKLAPAHRRPVGLRAVGSASFMNNPAVCPPIRGNLSPLVLWSLTPLVPSTLGPLLPPQPCRRRQAASSSLTLTVAASQTIANSTAKRRGRECLESLRSVAIEREALFPSATPAVF